jgi:hypothetical protein
MTVIINLVDTTEYFEVGNKVCFQLEAKLNASRFVDKWSDLGDKLYRAGSGDLDLISVPEHQYQFLKTALKAPEPRPEDIMSLRKVAFDDEPKFEWAQKSSSDLKRESRMRKSESRKVVGYVIPAEQMYLGGGITFWPLR